MSMAIHKLASFKGADNQVFEYSDTLSLPVDTTTYTDVHVGDIVKVGDILGVLMTEVAPTAAKIAEMSEVYGWVPRSKPTYGLNGPGYASIRVHGGVFKFTVAHSEAEPVGTKVYAIAGGPGKGLALTTDSTAAGAEVFGWLYNAAPAGSTSDSLPVVFDTRLA